MLTTKRAAAALALTRNALVRGLHYKHAFTVLSVLLTVLITDHETRSVVLNVVEQLIEVLRLIAPPPRR